MNKKVFLTSLVLMVGLTACDNELPMAPAEDGDSPQFAMTSTDWNWVEDHLEDAEVHSMEAEDGMEYIENNYLTGHTTIDNQLKAFENILQTFDTNVEQAENAAQSNNEGTLESEFDQIADINLSQIRWAIGNMKGCLNTGNCSQGTWPSNQGAAIAHIEDALDHLVDAQAEIDAAEVDLANEQWLNAAGHFYAARTDFNGGGWDIDRAHYDSASGSFRTLALTVREMIWDLEKTFFYMGEALTDYAAGQSSGGGGGPE